MNWRRMEFPSRQHHQSESYRRSILFCSSGGGKYTPYKVEKCIFHFLLVKEDSCITLNIYSIRRII